MSNQTADVIAYNGKIATQNEHWSIVKAIAIRDGKFLAAGSDREMMAGARRSNVDHQSRQTQRKPGAE